MCTNRHTICAVFHGAGLIFLLALFFAGCAPEKDHVLSLTGEALGTYYSATCIPAAPMEEAAVRRIIDDALETVNALMSTYRPDSELSRFNQCRDSAPFPVSPKTYEVFRLARDVSEQSGGAFDITVGPLVNAWGFGPEAFTNPPDPAKVSALLERVGYDKVQLHPEGALSKSHPEVYCDLSAIAKGYAVDEAARALEAAGITRYMVEVGGEVRVSGLNCQGAPWRLGIEAPIPGERELFAVVHLDAGALATSGDYRNMYELDGKRISHTMDPHTGNPVQSRLVSASVIHASCTLADAYATAIMALGDQRALDWAREQQLDVLLIIAPESGTQFETRMTDGFKKHLKQP